jgi:hypothetical protein
MTSTVVEADDESKTFALETKENEEDDIIVQIKKESNYDLFNLDGGKF